MHTDTHDTVLSLRNISKQFGALKAVSDVSFDVARGRRCVLIGTNGAGKTTLFNIIAGDLSVSSGEVYLFGQNVTKMPVHRRVKLGMRRTYQTSALFNGLTVRENFYLALAGEKGSGTILNPFKDAKKDKGEMQRIEQMAEKVFLYKKVDELVGSLSHGQRRQLEFGLALISNPKLLLFDEPASGLSAEERRVLLEMIDALDTDTTLLMIEHDMDVAFEVADEIIVMYEGAIVAKGTVDEIRHNNLVYDIYLGGRFNGNTNT